MTLLRITESPIIYKFNSEDLQFSKNIAKLVFIRSKNNPKTLLWVLLDNETLTNKNIQIFTQKHKAKIEKLLTVPSLQARIYGNVSICSEFIVNTEIHIWINAEYFGLESLKQVIEFMPESSKILTILSKNDEISDLQEFCSHLKDVVLPIF